MKDKDLAKELTNVLYTADLILRINALENLLIAKGICSREELGEEITKSSHQILKAILEKAGVPGDLDQIVHDMDVVANMKIGTN